MRSGTACSSGMNAVQAPARLRRPMQSRNTLMCAQCMPAVKQAAVFHAHRLHPLRSRFRRNVVTHLAIHDQGLLPDNALALWRQADAVCFDVDCTITQQDSLDLLAEYMGVGEEVAQLTNQAMDGAMNLEKALEKRLEVINCKPADLKGFLTKYPAETRLVPGIRELITALQARNKAVYLISGGFRELTLPIARALNIPASNVFANRMNWQFDDDTGLPDRLVGFDEREPTAHNRGKPTAIARLRHQHPYETIVMIGDGITDLEAAQVAGGADLFIGYGGVIERAAVKQGTEAFIYDHNVLLSLLDRYKVAMVGSGAWACAALRMVAANCKQYDPADEFVDEVRMWVYPEKFENQNLAQIINDKHENVKYFPGFDLGDNVLAVEDVEETVQDADIIIFCAPHQFMHGICKQLQGKVKPGAIAISLTKGMRVRTDKPQLISQMVQRYLGIDCSVLMGANIATDIGKEQLSEATIGYSNIENARLFQKLFQTSYFYVSLVNDVAGAEMCGTLKNVVAVAAGIIDGLGYGANTKAAIIRAGLNEMKEFCRRLYPNVREETFFESCGIADLIATCYGGRNRLVAEAWAKSWKEGVPRSFDELEADLLKGQKLQGVLTSNEVQQVLIDRGWERDFPLFTTLNRIVSHALLPDAITNYAAASQLSVVTPRPETFTPPTSNGAGDAVPTAVGGGSGGA